MQQGYETMRFDRACEAALSISSRGNQYLEETAPWSAFKKGSDEDKAEAAKVLVAVLESVRIVAVLLSPITPSLSTRIYLQLGFTQGQIDAVKWDDCLWGQLEAGQEMPKPFPVMARLEGEFVAEPAPAAPLEVNV